MAISIKNIIILIVVVNVSIFAKDGNSKFGVHIVAGFLVESITVYNGVSALADEKVSGGTKI
ncbi:MAG: hypothetical protein GY928_15390, partial [Colwellia sp.]|nr:hypothetical protein [Colwellia sp.]